MKVKVPAASIHQQQPVYLPFVGSASLHPKTKSRTVIKEPLNNLPELCHGCRSLTAHLHSFKGYLHLDGSVVGDGSEMGAESGRGESEFEGLEYGVVGGVMGGGVRQVICHGCSISEVPQ